MKVCIKELRETHVWLAITDRKRMIADGQKLQAATSECNELISIFVTSIGTAKRNQQKE